MRKPKVKFPHSPILHYAFSSWIEKTTTKQYITLWKTELFYNGMGLCGNLPKPKILFWQDTRNCSNLIVGKSKRQNGKSQIFSIANKGTTTAPRYVHTQEVILYANKFLSLFGVNNDSKQESLNQINLVHGC